MPETIWTYRQWPSPILCTTCTIQRELRSVRANPNSTRNPTCKLHFFPFVICPKPRPFVDLVTMPLLGPRSRLRFPPQKRREASRLLPGIQWCSPCVASRRTSRGQLRSLPQLRPLLSLTVMMTMIAQLPSSPYPAPHPATKTKTTRMRHPLCQLPLRNSLSISTVQA